MHTGLDVFLFGVLISIAESLYFNDNPQACLAVHGPTTEEVVRKSPIPLLIVPFKPDRNKGCRRTFDVTLRPNL